jgi:deazaflavin-dependent oxidoreductase (nitroreductase family)
MSGFNERIIDEFRANNGTVTAAGFGRGLVLLHHVGAKSGTLRVSPVMSIPTESGTWLVAASKAGADENPGWYHNLLAHPEITMEIPDEGEIEARVTELTGTERDAAWSQFTARSEGFRQYEAKTARVIPVLEISRR